MPRDLLIFTSSSILQKDEDRVGRTDFFLSAHLFSVLKCCNIFMLS